MVRAPGLLGRHHGAAAPPHRVFCPCQSAGTATDDHLGECYRQLGKGTTSRLLKQVAFNLLNRDKEFKFISSPSLYVALLQHLMTYMGIRVSYSEIFVLERHDEMLLKVL